MSGSELTNQNQPGPDLRNHTGPSQNNGSRNYAMQSPPQYIDSSWGNNFLMDPNSDLLYNMDFTSNNNLDLDGKLDPKLESKLDPSVDPALQEPKEDLKKDEPIAATKSKQRRPCDHCRRKKTKCVIIPGTNNCAQCESKSLTCTYVGQPSKRKMTDVPPAQEQDVKRLRTDTDEIIPPNVAIRDVDPVHDYSVINNSLLKKTLSLQFPRSSFYVGPTSYLYDVNLLNLIISSQNSNKTKLPDKNGLGKIEQINLSNTISLRKVSERAQFILKDDQSPQSYQTMSNDVDTIEKFIAPHGQILIDLYFRIIHPSYPILHKKVFLEKYSRTHREFSAPLLAAVYVLAIQWWDYDPQLNRFPRPNVDLILKIGLNNYLLEILKRPKLSAVQAGLLLLQCKHILRVSHNTHNQNSPAPSPGNSRLSFNDSDYSDWVLCSQVIALSEELGLGLNCNNWKLPKWERGLRKRLAWAVYMEDKWLSLKNSRPSHINDINWVVVNLLEEDFPEKHGDGDLKEGSSDIDNGKKNFMCLIELSMILSDILNQFYSMKAMAELNEVSKVLQLAKPIQLKLREWYHSLPVELQMSSVQPRKLCSNGYLQLAYFATELTLHRKIITILYQQIQNGDLVPEQLITVCRAAAKTRLLASVDFVRDLKPEHIHSFWHSSSAANFTFIGTFAAILFMSSATKEESEFYRDQIYNYRWILKISSKGFDQAGEALMKLDLVLNHIPGLLNDNTDLPMVVPNVPTIDYLKMKPESRPSPGFNGDKLNSNRAFLQSSYSTPQFHTPSSQPPISRGGQFSVNSPQSSQGLSPKEIIKQQKPVTKNNSISFESDKSPKKDSTSNSPVSYKSPSAFSNPPKKEQDTD